MSASHTAEARQSTGLYLNEFVRRVARELRIAASVADDCQDAFGDDENLDLTPELAMRLQGLDLLSQQLVELGKLFDRMASAGVSGEISESLLDDIVLSDLRRRLTGQADGIRLVDPDLW